MLTAERKLTGDRMLTAERRLPGDRMLTSEPRNTGGPRVTAGQITAHGHNKMPPGVARQPGSRLCSH